MYFIRSKAPPSTHRTHAQHSNMRMRICMHAKTNRTLSAVTRAQHINYDTSQKLNSRTTRTQSCIQQANITHNYSNRPETNTAESVWAFFTDPQQRKRRCSCFGRCTNYNLFQIILFDCLLFEFLLLRPFDFVKLTSLCDDIPASVYQKNRRPTSFPPGMIFLTKWPRPNVEAG